MRDQEYTLTIRYRDAGSMPQRQTRKIPFQWYPSGSEIFECIRRLRSQTPGVEVLSCTLYQTVLIERINIGDSE